MAKIERTIKVILTPKELAVVFASWDANEQAQFFNSVGEITDNWNTPFCFQAQGIADSLWLNQSGRDFMAVIGDYSGHVLSTKEGR